MNKEFKKIIVVLDENIELHDVISSYFKPKGFNVTCYLSPTIALTESLKSGSEWDILLTDYHFPNMAAVEFTKTIKKNLPLLPVILITPFIVHFV